MAVACTANSITYLHICQNALSAQQAIIASHTISNNDLCLLSHTLLTPFFLAVHPAPCPAHRLAMSPSTTPEHLLTKTTTAVLPLCHITMSTSTCHLQPLAYSAICWGSGYQQPQNYANHAAYYQGQYAQQAN
jgi:hypothetical protein